MKRKQLVITGASGRMGRILCDLVSPSDDWKLIAAVAHSKSKHLGQPCCNDDEAPAITPTFGGNCETVIDFSTEHGTAIALQIALQANAALLVATTGLSDHTRHAVEAAGQRIPILIAPNTSLGITVIATLLKTAARAFKPEQTTVHITEAHHKNKRDKPSGTALNLGSILKEAGHPIEPTNYTSHRAGDIIGEHTLRLTTEGEYIEFRHVATSRTLFAHGALHAANWLTNQPPGLYTMAAVLNLQQKG